MKEPEPAIGSSPADAIKGSGSALNGMEMTKLDQAVLLSLLLVLTVPAGQAAADTSNPPASNDFAHGVQDGNCCAPVKDSLDLVECLNFVKDRGRRTAKEPAVYDAGIFVSGWGLEDAIFQELLTLPATPRRADALKVSRDITVGAFVAAQSALKRAGLEERGSLKAARPRGDDTLDRWSYWKSRPRPN